MGEDFSIQRDNFFGYFFKLGEPKIFFGIFLEIDSPFIGEAQKMNEAALFSRVELVVSG